MSLSPLKRGFEMPTMLAKEILPNLTTNELIEIAQVSKPYKELAEQIAKERLEKMKCNVISKRYLTALSMCEQLICLYELTVPALTLDSLKILNKVYSKNRVSYFGKICDLNIEEKIIIMSWIMPGIKYDKSAPHDFEDKLKTTGIYEVLSMKSRDEIKEYIIKSIEDKTIKPKKLKKYGGVDGIIKYVKGIDNPFKLALVLIDLDKIHVYRYSILLNR